MTMHSAVQGQLRMILMFALMLGLFGLSACHQLKATSYTSGHAGSFDIVDGTRNAVALANVSQDSSGVKVIVFGTRLPAGTHAIHIHANCGDAGDAIPGGRLGNIEIPATGIGKREAIIKGGDMADLIGKTLVIHSKKDGGLTSPEIGVGGTVGCGTIKEAASRPSPIATRNEFGPITR